MKTTAWALLIELLTVLVSVLGGCILSHSFMGHLGVLK